VISGHVHKDNLDKFYPLFIAAILKPGFKAEDFERIKSSCINGIENSLRFHSDEELGKATLGYIVYSGTPYAHPVLGLLDSLKSITIDDVKLFWNKYFTRDNCVLGLGGSYSQSLLTKLRSDLNKLPHTSSQRIPVTIKVPELRGRHVTIVCKPQADSTAISFGHNIDVHRGQREFYALWLANSWLGEHRNSVSHLYQYIREERGLNYGDYSYIEAYPSGGTLTMPPTGVSRRFQMFEVWIRPVPEQSSLFALRAGLKEVETLLKNGLTKEQFEYTRDFLKKYCLHFAETTSERLGYAIDDRFYGITGEGHLLHFRKMMDSLTHEEVNAAIKKYMSLDNIQIALVTAHAEDFKKQISNEEKTTIDYGGIPKSQKLLEDDVVISTYPFKIPADNIHIIPVEHIFSK